MMISLDKRPFWKISYITFLCGPVVALEVISKNLKDVF